MKKQYEYTVGNFQLSTREAARMVQRSLRQSALNGAAIGGVTPVVPRIVQKLTVERIVR